MAMRGKDILCIEKANVMVQDVWIRENQMAQSEQGQHEVQEVLSADFLELSRPQRSLGFILHEWENICGF